MLLTYDGILLNRVIQLYSIHSIHQSAKLNLYTMWDDIHPSYVYVCVYVCVCSR